MSPKTQIEIPDDEFDAEVQERQHKEILRVLKEISASNKGNDKSFTEAVQSFLSKIKEFSTPVIPAPQVTINNNEILKAINDAESKQVVRHKELTEIGNKIYKCLEESNELRKLPFEMIPSRDHGWITKVVGKPVFPQKSKYKA